MSGRSLIILACALLAAQQLTNLGVEGFVVRGGSWKKHYFYDNRFDVFPKGRRRRNGARRRAVGTRGKTGRGGSEGATALRVSELHVPGYAETKIPFILTEGDIAGDDDASSLRERAFSPSDYASGVPHRDGHLLHKTSVPVFTPGECRDVVNEAERVASQIEWTRNRHGNFPTTDLPLVELPGTLRFLRVALVERIYPLLRQQFGPFLPDPSKLRVADGFVVKYDAEGGQTELKPHRDGSVLSFNIALNPAAEFDGGGTWFDSLDYAVRIDEGEMVSHASGLLHGGQAITRGKRYILVAFVILEGYDSWSMRFYNQVRNL